MASLRSAFSQLRGPSRTSAPQWQQLRQLLRDLHLEPKARNTRSFATVTSDSNSRHGDDIIAREVAVATGQLDSKGGFDMEEVLKDIRGNVTKETNISLDLAISSRDGSAIHARPLPVSPSYFSRQPEFTDSYLRLQTLMRELAHLPTAPSAQLQRIAFRTLKDYRLAVGEDIRAAAYAKAMKLVKRLWKIHPNLRPQSVDKAIAGFVRDINPHNHKAKEIPIDKFGRALGVGKRKTSTARAWVVEGTGEVLVNGKSLAESFGRVHDRETAIWALKTTERVDKYNVWALVDGGGTTGQAEALAMAVGKALLAHEPALKPALRRAGVVTRDPRGVERKKAGHVKARKKPTWVKR